MTSLKFCSFVDCLRPLKANNLCGGHDSQRRRGVTLSPLRKMAPRGAGSINDGGYRMLYRPKHPNSVHGRIAEHRLVMSNNLGRPLLVGENVHHKNGNKLDNDISNLELWVTYQPHGQSVLDMVEWAHQILDLYGHLTPEHPPAIVDA